MKVTIIGYTPQGDELIQLDYEFISVQEAIDRYCEGRDVHELAISVFFPNAVEPK